MTRKSKAKIFLADERGLTETAWFRSRDTFNEHKRPLGNVYVLNDDILDSSRSLKMLVTERSYVILVPVVGVIFYRDSTGYSNTVAAGQSLIIPHEIANEFEISNPYQQELVNFLQIWIRADESNGVQAFLSTYRNVNDNLNEMVPVFWDAKKTFSPSYAISIGKFSGRGESIYHRKYPNTGIFAYVLKGVFEVEGRLLHERDGLALYDSEFVEIEALSNDAVILVFEDHFNQQ